MAVLHYKLFLGSYGGSEGGMYRSSYSGDYMSRGSDVCTLTFLKRDNSDNVFFVTRIIYSSFQWQVGGSSYSSMYSSRSMGSTNYTGTGSSGSYY